METTVFTAANMLYEPYALPYLVAVLHHNSDAVVEICLEDPQHFMAKNASALSIVDTYFPERFLLRGGEFAGIRGAAPRFLETPLLRSKYTYIGDIDFLILDSDITAQHVAHMESTGLPFSNRLRPFRPNKKRRLTGLHFTLTEAHYPIRIPDDWDPLENAEELLYRLVVGKGLPLPEEDDVFRPSHGIHLSIKRVPAGTNLGGPVWQMPDDVVDPYTRLLESDVWQEIYPFFHPAYRMVLLILETTLQMGNPDRVIYRAKDARALWSELAEGALTTPTVMNNGFTESSIEVLDTATTSAIANEAQQLIEGTTQSAVEERQIRIAKEARAEPGSLDVGFVQSDKPDLVGEASPHHDLVDIQTKQHPMVSEAAADNSALSRDAGGMNYVATLRRLRKILQPAVCLEIGPSAGSVFGSHGSRTISINPYPRVKPDALAEQPVATLFTMTSDDFFATHNKEDVLVDDRVGLAFIDGLHTFDQVLRDFINIERWSMPNGVIAIHDVIPPNALAASRTRASRAWCGDVWQIVDCLRVHRPDLNCLLVDTPPTGLLIVRNLDPGNDELTGKIAQILEATPEEGDAYERAVQEYLEKAQTRSPEQALRQLIASDGERKCIGGVSVTTIDPSDFTFYGYGEIQSKVEQAVRRSAFRCGQPSVIEVEDGVIVPSPRPPSLPGGGRGSGVIDAAGRCLAEANWNRWIQADGNVVDHLPTSVAVTPEITLDEDVVYLGWCDTRFGHLLLETLSRCWILPDIAPTVRVAMQGYAASKLGTVPAQIFQALGLAPDRFIQLDRPTQVRRLLVPESLYQLRHAVHERAGDVHRMVATRFLAMGEAGHSDQPVYLSRRLLPNDRRAIIGERELEEVLRDNGFLVVHPERMTLADQIRLFNRHQDIFAFEGSAAHSVLFALGSPRLHLFSGQTPRSDYFLVSKGASTPTTFVNCTSRLDGIHGGKNAPLLLDIATVCDYLDHLGLLTRRLRPRLARRLPARQEAFEEAFVYRTIVDAMQAGTPAAQSMFDEALVLAGSSWPLSLLLAKWHAAVDRARAESLTVQFVDLIAQERDLDRLARYAPDVASLAPSILQTCRPEVAERLASTLAIRFGLDTSVSDRPRQHPHHEAANEQTQLLVDFALSL